MTDSTTKITEIVYSVEELQKPYATPKAFQTGKVLGCAFAEGIQIGAKVRTKVGNIAWWTTSIAVQGIVMGVFFGGSAFVTQSLLVEHVLPKPTAQQIALVIQNRSFREKLLQDWLPRTGYNFVISFLTKNSSNTPIQFQNIIYFIARNIRINPDVMN